MSDSIKVALTVIATILIAPWFFIGLAHYFQWVQDLTGFMQ